jgi:putative ABC transport system substrate-binding protein
MLACVGTAARSQEPQKVYKVGRLSPGSLADPLSKATFEAFQDGLRDLGWVEGKNIVIENRWTGDKPESAGSLAAELVRLKVDVIVAVGSPMVQAAKQATTAIPIVMSGSGADPEAAGFVASLRRPGGNITGLSMLSTELSGKRLELLKEMAPKLGSVAVLRNPKFPAVAIQSKETELAAKSLSLQLRAWDVGGPPEIENAFASMSKARTAGLVVFSDPVILERNRGTIIKLALKHAPDQSFRRKLADILANMRGAASEALPDLIDSFENTGLTRDYYMVRPIVVLGKESQDAADAPPAA